MARFISAPVTDRKTSAPLAKPRRMQKLSSMESAAANPPCHLCGKESAIIMEDVAWCESCLHEAGSCCGEWLEEEKP
jgi:hypothetical protein